MATYLALSTTNYSQNGYTVFVTGNNKEEVKNEALELLQDKKYSQVLLSNLIVVSKSEAKKHGIKSDDAEYMANAHPDCVYI